MKFINRFLLLAVLLFSATSIAQTVIGKYAGEFLNLGAGGRSLGMGGANVAVVNDATSGYWNPAGLVEINYPQVMLMHEEHFGDLLSYNFASIAYPYSDDYTFAISMVRLSVDGIPDTRNALYDANGDGILDILSDALDYSKITEFNNSDYAFYFSFAKKYNEKINWGASVKLIYRDIAEYSAFGIGFDFGAKYKVNNSFTLAAALQDITTTLVAWDTGRNELISPTFKFGGAYKLKVPGGVLIPALDFDIRFENRKFASTFNAGPVSVDVRSGFEYNFKNIFSVRGGYNDVKQFTFGAGVKLSKLNIDYSFARFAESADTRFRDTHRISILFTLSDEKYRR